MSYIVFEGPDFAGKSTLTKKLAEVLGYRLVAEPFTESENAKCVKQAIINNTFNKETEIFLLASNRLEAFGTAITRNRHNGGVIGDRSVLSSMVYQITEGWSELDILQFNDHTLSEKGHDIYPDHLFFLDIDHETYLDRLSKADRLPDEKEKALMDIDNWTKLKEDYLSAIDWLTFRAAHRNANMQVHFITSDTTVEEIVAIINPPKLPVA